jgi:hypothetical protein
VWWKPFQMLIIAGTIAVFYKNGLTNPWASGAIGFALAWLGTRLLTFRTADCFACETQIDGLSDSDYKLSLKARCGRMAKPGRRSALSMRRGESLMRVRFPLRPSLGAPGPWGLPGFRHPPMKLPGPGDLKPPERKCGKVKDSRTP